MQLSISRTAVGIAALTLSLTGCGLDQHPAYSPNVKYGLRKDPIIKAPKELSDDHDRRYEPERPGLLPIMKFDDMKDPDHPYHAKSAKFDDKIMRDPTAVPAK